MSGHSQKIDWMKDLARRSVGAGLLATAMLAGALVAQSGEPPLIVLDGVEEMRFDRPESWAMKYFASVSVMTGLGTPEGMRPGAIELALEGDWVPSLSDDQRRVGFIGTKVEDLNRTDFLGRLRATFGLPRDFSLTLGYTPPIERNGATPELFDLAVARPVYESRSWRLGLRLQGQLGTVEGDLTCPEDIAGLEDPERNPDGCLEPSSDEVMLDYLGLELSATPEIWGERWQPHFGLSAIYADLELQVNARYSIFEDRERLRTDGTIWALTAGLGYRLGERFRFSGELLYAPLEVVRDPVRGSENDALFNARFLIRYALR